MASHKMAIHKGKNNSSSSSPTAASSTTLCSTDKARVTVKYDVGFSNALYIRGEGANLNWNCGIKMNNICCDEWIWECEVPFHTCAFKVLINDQYYELGGNHIMEQGSHLEYTPHF